MEETFMKKFKKTEVSTGTVVMCGSKKSKTNGCG